MEIVAPGLGKEDFNDRKLSIQSWKGKLFGTQENDLHRYKAVIFEMYAASQSPGVIDKRLVRTGRDRHKIIHLNPYFIHQKS